jgi:hypothetical protein
LILGGPEGAFGAGEERGGFVVFGGDHGGDTDGDGGHGFGGVVHGFDDLFADMTGAGGRGVGEEGDEDSIGATVDDVAVAGAVDTQGAVEVGEDLAIVPGVRGINGNDEKGERQAFRGTALPLAAKILRKL